MPNTSINDNSLLWNPKIEKKILVPKGYQKVWNINTYENTGNGVKKCSKNKFKNMTFAMYY